MTVFELKQALAGVDDSIPVTVETAYAVLPVDEAKAENFGRRQFVIQAGDKETQTKKTK